MSYILDALRRAESQRALGKVPGIEASAAASAAQSPGRRAFPAAAWIALAVAVAICVLIAWQLTAPAPAVTAAPATTPAPRAVERPVPALPAGPPVDVQAALAPPRVATPRAVASAASAPVATPVVPASSAPAPAASAAPATPPRIVGMNDLPPDVRQQLPALALSGSVYSESPSARLLVANGQVVREGDTVAPGVTLQQIQPRAAVVLFRGWRVLVPF